MTIKRKFTRFRAYQLCSAGSSFSYFNSSRFTLIEARYNETNKGSIEAEMGICGVDRIDNLHITSWDRDHCSPSELEEILKDLKPKKIEYPGYEPHSEAGKKSLKIVQAYKSKSDVSKKVVSVTPDYIKSLDKAENYGYKDTFHHPRAIDDKNGNNNSTVKHFRSGSFNVLILGDVECTNIASGLRRQRTIKNETDVMILAHHGANNGFTTSAFIKKVRPTIAIASADYANQFKHPKQEVRDLLHKNEVKLFTTKNGDVLVFSTKQHVGHYKVQNLKANSTEVSSEYDFCARKKSFLENNNDTIRARINKGKRGPKN